MAIADRILPLTRLLLGAAYADNEVHDKEREEVRALLEDLAGELPTDVELEIVKFDPKSFDLALTAGEFVGDSEDDRKKLLFLVSAVIEADEEIDFSEDEYLRALAGALLFGGPVLGVVLGPEYSGLSGPLAFYALATTLFAVACLIASQHLATGRIRESWVVLAGAGLQIVLLLLWHNSIAQLIAAQLVTMSVLLAAVVISHFAPYRGSAPGQPVADGPNPNIAKVA